MSDAGHTLKFFDKELDDLKLSVTRMGDLIQEQVALSIKAVTTGDTEAVARVSENDAKIHELKKDLEKEAVRILALRHPMVQDLRLTVSAIKMSALLERIGELARNTATRGAVVVEGENDSALTRSLADRFGDFAHFLVHRGEANTDSRQSDSNNLAVQVMGERVSSRLNRALSAYANSEVDPALSIWSSDWEIDEQYDALLGDLLSCMLKSTKSVGRCSSLLFVIKNLERIGDYAVNIAEIAYHVSTGEEIKGDRPRGAAPAMAAAAR